MGEGLVEAVTGLVGVSVAAGDVEGVSPAVNPAVAMAEAATTCVRSPRPCACFRARSRSWVCTVLG